MKAKFLFCFDFGHIVCGFITCNGSKKEPLVALLLLSYALLAESSNLCITNYLFTDIFKLRGQNDLGNLIRFFFPCSTLLEMFYLWKFF